MARLPRLVLPGIPHHVTQRGNGRAQTFFEPADYALYLNLLADAVGKARTQVWAYCLMPNHVHLVLTPSHEDGLRATLGTCIGAIPAMSMRAAGRPGEPCARQSADHDRENEIRWRSGRDSNPGYAFGVYSLSRRAPSTTRPPLRMLWKASPLSRAGAGRKEHLHSRVAGA